MRTAGRNLKRRHRSPATGGIFASIFRCWHPIRGLRFSTQPSGCGEKEPRIFMKKHVNQSQPNRIYLKATREWVEVSEEVYREHTRFHDAFRKRHQSHGQCVCPKNTFWLCDADCLTCEFRRAGDHISLDYTTENEDGDTCSPLDALADTAPSIEDVICDKAELDQLFARLNELMPEAQDIGKLRQKGLTDEAIAEVIGIKRTTFRSRLAKAKKQLAAEFPDRF